MFEITPDEIAALSDEDLRSLVARLCEAELRRKGLSTSSVTWGGDQNAPDGGLDVRVDLPKKKAVQGFVPRNATGFQVKKSDMARTDILKEMRPNSKVRAVIRDLAKQSGAYVIVSSNGSVSDSALRKRREAMADAVKGIKGAGLLALDFYDRGRVATWLRDHPGLIPWVRQKVGKSIRGWQSYGAWAYASEEEKAPYLLDDKLRIHTGKRENGNGVSAADGLVRIRDILRDPRKIVRIVGLSGVGKTRFVQALFDKRVGKAALNPSLAIYTNMADDPDPQPVGLASDLIASKTRAILIVDNCAPDLHRRLSEACRSPASLLSLVTVEYDIRDDDPEETDVFRLEPSSPELIEKLVRARFKSLSQVDARTVAEFSGGNARIAIALAGTIGKNETIAGLTDEDLFGRLFQQRHDHDASLLLIGQACALVYSFQGEAIVGDEAELPIFAAMIGKNVDEIFRGVAELKNRELVQQRGVWRAVLPHAIANRLAAMALKNIPQEKIKSWLIEGKSARLLKSFSRRLGYLHDNRLAVGIVEQWLAKSGLLANVANFNAIGMAMFDNVAPVAPEAVLATLERVAPETISERDTFERIIRSIAYDPKLFERCVELLLRYGAIERESIRGGDSDRHFTSLFYIVFSGTHASIEQRLAIIEALLRSDNSYRRVVGVKALRNVLEAWHFGSGHNFEFGARPRDYGAWPKTGADLKHWYASALKLVETLALSNLPIAAEVRGALAGQFRGLWSQPLVQSDLDRICRSISKAGFWREGWIAVRQTLNYDSKGMKKTTKSRLVTLEKVLKPNDLIQNVRGIVLSNNSQGLVLDDFDYDDDDGGVGILDRLDSIAVGLGKDTAQDPKAFKELLAELVGGSGRLWVFGRGLAAGADDPHAMWNSLVAKFAETPEATRNAQILRGFLEGLSKREPKLASALLDDAVAHDALAAWFPELQTAVVIDKRGVERLHHSLTLGKVPAWRFRVLAWGRVSDAIAGPDLKSLLLAISLKPDGFDVAIDILDMRFFSDKQNKKPFDSMLIEAGRELLDAMEFPKGKQDNEHRIGSLIKKCLSGEGGASVAEAVCQKFKDAVANRETYAFYHDQLMQSLFKVQPAVALESFLGGDDANQKRGCEIISDVSHNHKNPLDFVPLEVLVAWCDHKPGERYPFLARVVSLYQGKDDQSPLEWNADALAILEKAPDRVTVLKQFVFRFRPMSWSGSRAAAMETRLPLLRKLEEHADLAVAAFARSDGIRLKKEVEQERQQETRDDKASDERFE